MRTLIDVFAVAPWYMASLMGLALANTFVELWWWHRAPSRKAHRQRKWLIRSAVSLILFSALFVYYYQRLPAVMSQ